MILSHVLRLLIMNKIHPMPRVALMAENKARSDRGVRLTNKLRIGTTKTG